MIYVNGTIVIDGELRKGKKVRKNDLHRIRVGLAVFRVFLFRMGHGDCSGSG